MIYTPLTDFRPGGFNPKHNNSKYRPANLATGDRYTPSRPLPLKFGWVVTPNNISNKLPEFNYPALPSTRSRQGASPTISSPPLQEWYQPLLLHLLQVPKSNANKQERTAWLKQLNIICINLIVALNSDPLTGLWNRAFFDKQLAAQVDQAKSRKESVCLAVIDVNDFKAINEACGHPFGDHALQTFANILKDSSPKGSSLCRIGGDEFAIIFPNNTNSDTAREALEPMEQTLKQTPAIDGTLTIYLSGSFGISEIKSPTNTLNAYKSADTALGEAKKLKADSQIFSDINKALQDQDSERVKRLMSEPRESLMTANSI